MASPLNEPLLVVAPDEPFYDAGAWDGLPGNMYERVTVAFNDSPTLGMWKYDQPDILEPSGFRCGACPDLWQGFRFYSAMPPTFLERMTSICSMCAAELGCREFVKEKVL